MTNISSTQSTLYLLLLKKNTYFNSIELFTQPTK